MQILASALPGFRDLRAPLIAGYLWLVFLWILIKPDIKTRPPNGAAAAVYDLAKDAGPIWIGLAVGVAAYLIGSVSQALSPMLSRVLPAAFDGMIRLAERLSLGWLEGIAWRLSGQWSRRMHADWGRAWAAIDKGSQSKVVEQTIQQYMSEAANKLYQDPSGTFSDNKREIDAEIAAAGRMARRGLESELELPATLLLGKDPDPRLFSEADRLRAERELRLAVVPPLLAIAIFLAWNQSSWWWSVLMPVVVLLWQGHTRNLAFQSLMLGAVQRGLARSQSIDELKLWVDSIPPPSPEQKRANELDRDDQIRRGVEH